MGWPLSWGALMTLTKQQVREVLDVYIRAWTEQDPELITTIFTPGAAYNERVLEAPILGRDGIRATGRPRSSGARATSSVSCSTSTWTARRRSPSGKPSLTTGCSTSASECGRSPYSSLTAT
jgi:hypothetical protein